MKIRFFFVLLALPLLAFKSPTGVSEFDLSTPEKSFESFVSILQSESMEALESVVTPTGMSSLVQVSSHDDYQDGMADLGKELAVSQLNWSPITDDIYFLVASIEGKKHKIEFTKEEPGWMVYHWQLGGGVDESSAH